MIQVSRIRIKTPDNNWHELSPYGRRYSEDIELITREDRAADGTLRQDIIAEKKTFALKYSYIDDIALNAIKAVFDGFKGVELTLETTHGSVVETYTVLMRPYSKERESSRAGGLWTGVSAVFVEV